MRLLILALLLIAESWAQSGFEDTLAQIQQFLNGSDVSSSSCTVGNRTTTGSLYPPQHDHIGNVKPKVQTGSGLLTGARLEQGNAFFNVPYAVPPVGIKRFTRPEPLTGSSTNEVDVSVKVVVACYQDCLTQNGSTFNNFTEDCLTLNVYTPLHVNLTDPAAPPSDRLPVIFWLYGGSLLSGSSNFPIYDGRFLSNASDVIVVGVNYRLGIFGFLAFNENGEEVKGNQGFKDQQLALKWVQDNIEKFGGDKNQVAIVGQSAGAQSVMFHLMSAESRPMFQRAILESNPLMFKYQTLEEAFALVPMLLDSTGCAIGGIACLRSAAPEQIVSSSSSLMPYYLLNRDVGGLAEPWKFILDEDEFTAPPMDVFRSGGWSKEKDVIMGTVMNEISLTKSFPIPMPKILYEGLVDFVLGPAIATNATELYAKYAVETLGVRDYRIPLGMLFTDCFFKCPVRALARFASASATGKNVYLYSYNHTNNGADCEKSDIKSSCGVATHSTELALLFRTYDYVRYSPTPDDWLVSDQLGFYWSNMARSGSPNQNDTSFTTWPAYTDQNSQWINLNLDSKSKLQTNYMQELCDFWDNTGYYINVTSSDGDVSSTTTTSGAVGHVSTISGFAAEDTTSGSRDLTVSVFVLLLPCLVSIFC